MRVADQNWRWVLPWAVLGLLLILTLAMTYPLITYMTEAVPGPPGDNLSYLWKLWWFKHALFERHCNPLFNPEVFYPTGYDLQSDETSLANVLIGMPFILFGSDVMGFNALIILSYILSGLGMYLLAYYITGNRIAGLAGGVFFAFAPYRAYVVGAGWINSIGTQWLPLMLLYVEMAIRKRVWTRGAMTGFFYALTGLSSWYYAWLGAILLLLYVLLRARPWQEYLNGRQLWACLLAFALVTAGLFGPVVFSMVCSRAAIGSPGVPLSDGPGMSLDDFVVPSLYHPFWGPHLLEWRNGIVPGYPFWIYGLGYLGWVVLGLAALAIWRWRRGSVQSEGLVALVIISVVCAVLALGPLLHVAGRRVYISVPATVETLFNRAIGFVSRRFALHPTAAYYHFHKPGTIWLPMPTYFLYLWVPTFNMMRIWARFGLLTTLAVCAIAAMGVTCLLENVRRQYARWAIVVIVMGLAMADFATMPLSYGRSLIVEQPYDVWLREHASEGPVMAFPPLEVAMSTTLLYSTKFHGRPVCYGFTSFYPPHFQEAVTKLWGFPDEASLTVLKRWGVRYVMVFSSRYEPSTWRDMLVRLEAEPSLRLVARCEEKPIFEDDRLDSRNIKTETVISRAMFWDPGTVYIYECNL